MATPKKDIVQLKNPRTGRYIKVDRGEGGIMSYKKTPGPYKGIKEIKISKKIKTQ